MFALSSPAPASGLTRSLSQYIGGICDGLSLIALQQHNSFTWPIFLTNLTNEMFIKWCGYMQFTDGGYAGHQSVVYLLG